MPVNAALGEVLPSVNVHRAGLSMAKVLKSSYWPTPVEYGGGNDGKLLYIYHPNDAINHGMVGNESGNLR